MSFLNPLALLGLVAAAIPALLHLLQRRTPPELDFPPIRYLSEAERQSARRLKLRHLLLLILRTALIVVIVLAAARPLVSVAGGGTRGADANPAHAPTALVVILDNSPSSGAVVDGRPVFERLRAAARASLARANAADRTWLVLSDGVVRGGTPGALLASVDSAEPGWQRLDLVAAVERAARVAGAEPLPGREIHVLSDLQVTALAEGRAAVRDVRVLVLAPPETPPAPNRGIADVRVAEGAAVVTVTGSGMAEPVPVTLRVARRSGPAGESRALAALGSAVPLPIPAGARVPGWWVGEASLVPDEFRADDRRLVAWHVAEPAAAAATPAAGPFVAAALAVLREGQRVREPGGVGSAAVLIGETPPPGGSRREVRAVIHPPADAALVGQANRALAARGITRRWAGRGTPGPIASTRVPELDGQAVTRRLRLEPAAPLADSGADVLATVNGEPWLVRSAAGNAVLIGSRLDTSWTALPAAPAFVPFIDALVNRIASGAAQVGAGEGHPRVEFRTAGGDTVAATVFGVDSRESDLTRATAEAAAQALGGDDAPALAVADDAFDAARFAGAGVRRIDLSGALLLVALLLAAAELGVAALTR
ncbi:MAG: BatA domain-containing protein [Gemmatimonadales bacterium]